LGNLGAPRKNESKKGGRSRNRHSAQSRPDAFLPGESLRTLKRQTLLSSDVSEEGRKSLLGTPAVAAVDLMGAYGGVREKRKKRRKKKLEGCAGARRSQGYAQKRKGTERGIPAPGQGPSLLSNWKKSVEKKRRKPR